MSLSQDLLTNISARHNKPSLFAGFKHSVQADNILQPPAESESTLQNAQVALSIENTAMGLVEDAALSDENNFEAHDAMTDDGDEIDFKQGEESTLELVENESI